jgi:membrane protein required for colicin V production
MSLTLFDIIVIVVVLVSALLAMVRGFVREVLSVASWVIAAVAAYYVYPALKDVIYPSPITDETLATIIAIGVIFIIVLIIATYITMRIADYVIDSRVGAIDRILGLLFGAARGLLLLVIAFTLFIWLVPEQPTWISGAQSYNFMLDLRGRLIDVLPEDLATQIEEGFQGEPAEEGTPVPTPTPAAPVGNETPGGNLPPIPENLFPPAPTPAP